MPIKTPPATIATALICDVSCDALERRTFDFFRSRTAPCVSGYFSDPVWDRFVLQVSHSEPTVRYAFPLPGDRREPAHWPLVCVVHSQRGRF